MQKRTVEFDAYRWKFEDCIFKTHYNIKNPADVHLHYNPKDLKNYYKNCSWTNISTACRGEERTPSAKNEFSTPLHLTKFRFSNV